MSAKAENVEDKRGLIDETEREYSHISENLSVRTTSRVLEPVKIEEVVREQLEETYCSQRLTWVNWGDLLPFLEDKQGIFL